MITAKEAREITQITQKAQKNENDEEIKKIIQALDNTIQKIAKEGKNWIEVWVTWDSEIHYKIATILINAGYILDKASDSHNLTILW